MHLEDPVYIFIIRSIYFNIFPEIFYLQHFAFRKFYDIHDANNVTVS